MQGSWCDPYRDSFIRFKIPILAHFIWFHTSLLYVQLLCKGGEVMCPECRDVSAFAAAKKNFHSQSLIDVYNQNQRPLSSRPRKPSSRGIEHYHENYIILIFNVKRFMYVHIICFLSTINCNESEPTSALQKLTQAFVQGYDMQSLIERCFIGVNINRVYNIIALDHT